MSTTDTTVLLRTRGLAVVYPNGRRALLPCDLDVRRGEMLALLGPSGSGKSTMLRSLNGLVERSEGEVWMQGVGVADDARRWRALRTRMAMIFQHHQLIGRRSALANVLTGRLGRHSAWRTMLPFPRADRIAALAALERVGLLDHALDRCDQLSGGQQQRVGIARALAQEPAIVLADEPVASLDPATAERVLGLLRGICRSEGIAAIVSLHQVDLARRFADRIVALSQGRLVFDGRASALDASLAAEIYGAPPPSVASADAEDAGPVRLAHAA